MIEGKGSSSFVLKWRGVLWTPRTEFLGRFLHSFLHFPWVKEIEKGRKKIKIKIWRERERERVVHDDRFFLINFQQPPSRNFLGRLLKSSTLDYILISHFLVKQVPCAMDTLENVLTCVIFWLARNLQWISYLKD